MKTQKTSRLDSNQKKAVLGLWNTEYPSQLAYPDVHALDEYLDNLIKPLHYLLLTNENQIVGWALTFEREGSQWFAIIIDSNYQRMGFGAKLLNSLKSENQTLNGWVTDHDNYFKRDGSTYTSPLSFYLKNGFHLISDKRLETDQLSAVKISYQGPN